MSTFALPPHLEIKSLLGEGGAGRVHRVLDRSSGRQLALKIVSAAHADFLRREFDALRQIRHENMIQVFQWGALPSSGEAYYTMELVEGEDWSHRVGAQQSFDEVRRILTGVLRALAHLHSHGEIHGDLKPGNVLLGAGGVVKVTDVGMGVSDPSGGMAGTPGYAAPECWEGKDPDLRSDLYSVGVMAYEALTGSHPFAGRTIRDVVAGQMKGWVASPRAHVPDVPADLERAVMRALERDPALRQSSADAFLEAIGVTDRIGVILGGRYVGRDEEVRRVRSLVDNRSPSSPTLVSVVGPVGSGRSSLLAEVSQTVMSSGGVVVDWTGASLEDLVRWLPATVGSGDSGLGLSGVGDRIRQVAETGFLLIVVEPPDGHHDLARSVAEGLARYLHTIGVESAAPVNVLILFEGDGPQAASSDYEEVVHLPPLGKSGVREVLVGLLGRADLEEALVERLTSASAGIPDRVIRTALDLIARGVLGRRDGIWRFIEKEQIRDLHVGGVVDQFQSTWATLNGKARELLVALSIVPSGLALDTLAGLSGEGGPKTKTRLETLAIRGLASTRRDVWAPSTSKIQEAIADAAGPGVLMEIAGNLKALSADDLDEEGRSALTGLAERNCDAALRSARLAIKRRDYSVAEWRARLAEAMARETRDEDSLRKADLTRAECLHRLGRHEAARDLLRDAAVWGVRSDDGATAVEREYLLGQTLHALGDLAGARTSFEAAIESATLERHPTVLIGAHGELAEIEWRYEDAHSREACIQRLREILVDTSDRDDLAEQRASLVYQLGAALIELGKREDAQSVLEGGLEIPCGAYWRMRMRNALATIHYYHSDFAGSLELLNAAWRDAEENNIDSFKARILSNRAGIHYAAGRFADSVEQHALTKSWARRTGGSYEYLAGCLGEAINLTYLARYEDAIEGAREARRVATALPNLHEVAKAIEIEGLAFHCLGDDDSASRLLAEGESHLEGRGFDDVRPRLDWLGARIAGRKGDFLQAEKRLRRALGILAETPDWEDLPGVQIELDRLAWRRGDAGATTDRIRETTVKAEAGGAVIVAVRGCLVLSEILVDHGIDDPDLEPLLLRGLALAEQSGTREFVWRISCGLGRLALRRGDREMAQQRLSLSLRVLREVASGLSASHRQLYLATPHARTLLATLEAR